MALFDDETIRLYLEESRDHLANIENDLLAIEARGADIDIDLVNKVFRAAHSLKGGAAFFSFDNIKELAHKIENVLDLIRSKELVPNPEIVNILLLSFDKLRELVNNVEASKDMDISEFVVSLAGLTSSTLPKGKKDSIVTMRDIKLPGGRSVMQVPEYDLEHAAKSGDFVYLVEYDLIHDVQRTGKNPFDIVQNMMNSGRILECVLDVEGIGTLDDEPVSKVPFFVVFSTIAEPDMAGPLLDIDAARVHLLPQQKKAAMPAAPASLNAQSSPSPAQKPVVQANVQPVTPATSEMSASKAEESAAESSNRHPAQQMDQSLRVSVHLLESLMNLAGELVLSRNQLLQAITQNDQRLITSCSQRINLVTSELQEAIMMTRMQPIANIFNKFPRVVRDLAKTLGKDVRLDMTGKEVELDKTIIEGLSDPLTHLVRNSVDHGVETPEQRTSAGKSPTGIIHLRAYHEAGQVNIEVVDDGKGIDPKKISAAAVAKGLITAEKVKTMSDREKTALILLPGFSTAEKVTDVSGRGVGMDVVKTNIDRLGGQVDIESIPGKGSTIRIKLPLTLAIIPSLFVSVEGQRYAIPQVNVEELIRVPANQVKKRIERVGDAEVLILRGKMIPIIDLTSLLDIPQTYLDPGENQRKVDRRALSDRRSKDTALAVDAAGKVELSHSYDVQRAGPDRRYRAASDLNIVVVTTGSFEYGLVVEELHDSIEIVVKPLGRKLKHLREYAGATIMGDGRVALILDIDGMASSAGLTSLANTTRALEIEDEARKGKDQDVQTFLLFCNAPNEQCAVSLDLVQRIEQIKASAVETAAGRRVIKYRGLTMPVFTLGDVATVGPLADKQDMIAIIFNINDKEIGLLATVPVDAAEVNVRVDHTTLRQKGIMGSAIINDKTTLIIDIFELVETVHPEWFTVRPRIADKDNLNQAVLLAEDSDFFRTQVKKFIEGEGYRVIAAEDGQKAWNLLQENEGKVSLVVTDIEMPNMDGYGLSKTIKTDKRFSHLPIIALTSLAGDEDIARGKAAGIDDYQIKLDKGKLLEGINHFLHKKINLDEKAKEMTI
jgi:two-component system, chemotaxis family, sensor kinase CheA